MVSLDALAFVRFGLRAPDDPRIVSTVKVVDATLKVDTPRGPAWHRYQGDGYGEHADGGPFDGSGVGRAWPLLTGERAHYELAAGRTDVAEHLARAIERVKGADVALVVGAPMDFRLGFGNSFGEETQIVVFGRTQAEREHPRAPAVELLGGMDATLRALIGDGRDTSAWVAGLRAAETEKRAGEEAELNDDRSPLHPMRLYKELGEILDRDAIVIGDGGDFVSYAGRVINSYEPGCWLDPGPYGCLGSGPGYALAAKLARPDKQVVLLLGDGAFGFSGMEYDTLARHGVNVVGVMGNNGIWALEKHPMEFLYGYSVAADLRPGTRYDQLVEALGGHGELVDQPADLKPALARAFESGKPALVNVLTDPTVVYPRKSNLA